MSAELTALVTDLAHQARAASLELGIASTSAISDPVSPSVM